jgi:hypothetical protein
VPDYIGVARSGLGGQADQRVDERRPRPGTAGPAAHVTAPKQRPEDVAASVLDALAEGRHELLVDDVSRTVKSALAGDLTDLYPVLA